MTSATESALASMRAAGLPEQEAQEWSDAFPVTTGEYESDASALRRLLAPVDDSP